MYKGGMGMTRNSSYMRNMQEFDHHNDERYWIVQWNKALDNLDYEELDYLMKEAHFEDYKIPEISTSDPIILGI